MSSYFVLLEKIVNELKLEVIYTPRPINEIKIASADVNRPGFMLAGFKDHFDPSRIQVFGMMESAFLTSLSPEVRNERLKGIFSTLPPAAVVTRDLDIFDEQLALAKMYEVPLLRTSENTSRFMADATSLLSVELAPRITRHGVLVEVYGEGILITGDSGVGKSETAIELVKRGHRLIADDAVELRRVSNRTIVGTSPENIRYFVELRGIGIINVAKVFGMGAVKISERIDLIIELEPWNAEKNYSRTGLEIDNAEILGLSVPKSTIPVRPGRNLAIIIETAAINNRQKKLGYNAAEDLLEQLGLENDIS